VFVPNGSLNSDSDDVMDCDDDDDDGDGDDDDDVDVLSTCGGKDKENVQLNVSSSFEHDLLKEENSAVD
jgi:hypothetical protein